MIEEYIIHTKTSNLSFLKVHRYLKDKGVKNNKFFLRLYDKDLENVNPNSKRLSPIMQAKVSAEIAKNPYYYLREVALIDVPGGKVKFELHPGNLAISWALFNSLDFYVLLPRQQYKTVSIAACLVYILTFRTKNSHSIFNNKSLEDAKNNLSRFKAIRDNLPVYLKKDLFDPKLDISNLESIVDYKTKNKITVSGKPTNESMADNMGRGASVPLLWTDEFAFLPYNDIFLKAAAPAYRTVADLAESRGFPHSKTISTTPNNADSPSGAEAKKMIDEACTFFEGMYEWDRETIKEYIHNNSSNSFLYIKYTWQQLGKSQEWYNQMCRDLSWDWLKIKREVDLQWTKSSDNSVFSEEQLDILYRNIQFDVGQRIFEIRKENGSGEVHKVSYNFKTIKPLDPNKCYFVGCDVGGGLGRDYSTIVILDPHDDYREVAIFKNNTINLSNYKLLLLQVAIELKNSMFFIENNSYGKGIIDELLEYPKIAKRIYFDYKISDKDKTKSKPSKVTKNIQYGINTNSATRSLMIDIIREIVTDYPEQIVSEDIYDDIKGLIYNKQGKVEHDVSSHDDCMFAKLVVLYAVRYGNNISKFLRDADNIHNIQQRTKALSNNPLLNKEVNDPAKNHGKVIDVDILVKRLQSGESLEEIHKSLANDEKRGKPINHQVLNKIIN